MNARLIVPLAATALALGWLFWPQGPPDGVPFAAALSHGDISPVDVAPGASNGVPVAPAVATAAGKPEDQGVRQPVALLTTRTRVEAWLQAHKLPSGDSGIDASIRAIQIALAHPEQSHPHPPSVDQFVKDRDFNPLRVALSAEERAEVGRLIADYSSKINELCVDKYLELWMANVALVEAGSFERLPNGGNYPEGRLPPEALAESQRVFQHVSEKFGEDAIISLMAGRDMSHGRAVAVVPENSPDYWAVRDRLSATTAELSLALRTYFLSRRRQTR